MSGSAPGSPRSGVRQAAVAGRFYPAERAVLERQLRKLVGSGAGEPAIAAILPHAGYIYSGALAGRTVARLAPVARVVVLAVNHRGRGERVATWARGAWETPLGLVAIDEPLVAALCAEASFVRDDPRAHEGEHSLEVQLPLLQWRFGPTLRLTPISLATHDPAVLEELGRALARVLGSLGEPVLVIASTDMTHYQDAELARAEDESAIERMLALDGPGLLRLVLRRRISMCGVAPASAALVAARELGARRAELVGYCNSGDVNGDYASVVGYAGLVARSG